MEVSSATASVVTAPFPGAVPACAVDDVEDGEGLRVTSDDLPVAVAVFRVGDDFYALDDRCSHQDASLADGFVEADGDDCAVECPLHASCFDLRTGAVSGPPAKVGVRAHRAVAVDGVVWVGPR